jgi:hypothetical protein
LKRAFTVAVLGLATVALAACVAGSGESGHTASGGLIAQLLLGFWHGIIAPITLIGEIINHFAPHVLPWTVHMYETRAAGLAYDAGFYLGLAGGPSIFWTRWSRRP